MVVLSEAQQIILAYYLDGEIKLMEKKRSLLYV